jgi:hypothetical protein
LAEVIFLPVLKAKNPKKKKIAVVAGMRRLGIRMWHGGCRALAPEEVGLSLGTARP